MRLKMLDSITPGSGFSMGHRRQRECAHWGEIMSTAARERGCTGAVVDGGVRDLDFINAMEYPVFAKFKSAASSIGRWDIREYQVPIRIGATVIHPGDFVFGDVDGVVIVPQELTRDILAAAKMYSSGNAVCAKTCGGVCQLPRRTQNMARCEGAVSQPSRLPDMSIRRCRWSANLRGGARRSFTTRLTHSLPTLRPLRQSSAGTPTRFLGT
jgi:hypothetical protein